MPLKLVLLAALSLLSLLAAPIAHAQAPAWGWTTECAEGPEDEARTHMAIFDPPIASTGAGVAEAPVTFDCLLAVSTVTVLEHRPPTATSITLVGYARTCVAPVSDEMIVRVATHAVGGDMTPEAERTETFVARTYDPSGCGTDDVRMFTTATTALEVTARFAQPGPTPPPDVAALVPVAPETCGTRSVSGFAIPEAQAWLAFNCNDADIYLVRGGRVIAAQPEGLQEVISVLYGRDHTWLQARDAQDRNWIGEIGPDGLTTVAADGMDMATLAAQRIVERQRQAEWEREDEAEDHADALQMLLAAVCLLAWMFFVAVLIAVLARRKTAPSATPSTLARLMFGGYGGVRVFLGLALAALCVALIAAPRTGILPGLGQGLGMFGLLPAFATIVVGGLAVGAAIASARGARARPLLVIGIGCSTMFHLAVFAALVFWSSPLFAIPLATAATLEAAAFAVLFRAHRPT